jgi:hypothetical protein
MSDSLAENTRESPLIAKTQRRNVRWVSLLCSKTLLRRYVGNEEKDQLPGFAASTMP